MRSVLDHPPLCDVGMVLIKLDIFKVFCSVCQDHILEVCAKRAPSLLRMAVLADAKPSEFVFGNVVIMSETGVHQGDPVNPVWFAFSIDDIARSVTSPINVWHLDDVTFGGSPLSAKYYCVHIIPALSGIGFGINLSKFEVINISCNSFIDVVLDPGARAFRGQGHSNRRSGSAWCPFMRRQQLQGNLKHRKTT